MADEIKQAINAQAKLVPGGVGEFEVQTDGELIFSKKELGRFPEPGEVAALLLKKRKKK